MVLQQAGKFEAENDSASVGRAARTSAASERMARNFLNIFRGSDKNLP